MSMGSQTGPVNANVFDMSSGALQNAGGLYGTAAEMYQNPSLQGRTHKARFAGNIADGMDRYMNPYTDSVIDRATADMSRLNNIQLNNNAATAGMAGAFGGSRHGVVDSMTNVESQRALGDLSAGLRQEGFNTAAGLSAQDIMNRTNARQFNATQGQQWQLGKSADELARAAGTAGVGNAMQGLGETGFDIGSAITGQQQQQGGLMQQLMQSILSAGQGQYEQFTNQPNNMLDIMMSAISGSPLGGAGSTTQSSQPGLLDLLGLGSQLAGGWWGRAK